MDVEGCGKKSHHAVVSWALLALPWLSAAISQTSVSRGLGKVCHQAASATRQAAVGR